MKKLQKGLFILMLGLTFTACGNTTSSLESTGSSNQVAFDASKKIKVYTRDTDSGTRDGFFTKIGLKNNVKSNEGLVTDIVTTSGNGDMVLKIKNDEYSIGYISLSSLEESSLNGLKYDGVEPTEENVLSKSYELTRNFNYITRVDFDSDEKKQIVEAYVAYLSTKEAKATIIANSGIVKINSTDKSWNDIKANYPICGKDNSNITIKFGGSTSVEKIAKALSQEFASKCGNFKPEHNHGGSGDAYKFTQGEEKDSTSKLDVGFLSRELNSSEVASENTAGLICVDAIVAVTNQKNPLKDVTADDLKNIYTGTITKWSQIIK